MKWRQKWLSHLNAKFPWKKEVAWGSGILDHPYITLRSHTHTHRGISLPQGRESHKEPYSLSFHHAECILLWYLCEAFLDYENRGLSLPGVGTPGSAAHRHTPPHHTHTYSLFHSSLLPPHCLLHLSPHQPSTGFKWPATITPLLWQRPITKSCKAP